jgi:hypothetical protein
LEKSKVVKEERKLFSQFEKGEREPATNSSTLKPKRKETGEIIYLKKNTKASKVKRVEFKHFSPNKHVSALNFECLPAIRFILHTKISMFYVTLTFY